MSQKQEFYDERIFGRSVNPRHIEVYNQIKKLDMNFIKVLDVGCGAGTGLNYIKRGLNIEEAYGIDISPDALVNIDKYDVNGSCLDLDNEKFPFEDNFFDLIISIEVIEHLYNPDLYLNEILRVLKPNGIFIISTPNLSWWLNLVSLSMGYQPYYSDTSLNTSLGHLKGGEYNLGHLRLYSPVGLLKLVEFQGFKLVKKFGIEFIHANGIVKYIDLFIKKITPRYSCHIALILTKEE